MNLSVHFTLEEFEASENAARRGIDNSAPPDVISNLLHTADMLELVRTLLGDRPLVLTSGYRCPRLNKVIGGSANSQHIRGQAADFLAPGFGRPIEVCRRIVSSGIGFDQLINEHSWIHISFVSNRSRREVLTIDRQGSRAGLHEALQ